MRMRMCVCVCVWLRPALEWFIAQYDFMMLVCSEVRVKRGERAETRRTLRLCVEAMLMWARLMVEMVKVGISWSQYGVRLEGYSVAFCFDLRFPTGFRPGML